MLKIFSGSSHPELTRRICQYLKSNPSKASLQKFANLETNFEITESVRGDDVYIVQTAAGNVNDMLVELIIMIETARDARAGRITAVIPNFPYARQDKTCGKQVTISAKIVAEMLTTHGADHVITLDLHSPQIEGFFKTSLDHLSALKEIVAFIKSDIPNWQNAVVVAPDAGAAKRAFSIAAKLNLNVAHIHKERSLANVVDKMTLVGSVQYKTAIIVDDMVDTCGTLCKAASLLREEEAEAVYAICVHGIFSGKAIENLNNSELTAIAVTNSICQEENIEKCDKIKVIDVSQLLGEAIRRDYDPASALADLENF